MLSTTRCVFKCVSVSRYPVDGGQGASVSLSASYADDQGRQILQDFARATPSGSLTLNVDNPAAAVLFEEGAFYSLDIARLAPDAIPLKPTT